jgi:hypothetical protein
VEGGAIAALERRKLHPSIRPLHEARGVHRFLIDHSLFSEDLGVIT